LEQLQTSFAQHQIEQHATSDSTVLLFCCRWGEQWEQLQTSFEQHRATWLASDRAGWLARNQPYDGMVDAVAACEYPIYFASRWALCVKGAVEQNRQQLLVSLPVAAALAVMEIAYCTHGMRGTHLPGKLTSGNSSSMACYSMIFSGCYSSPHKLYCVFTPKLEHCWMPIL
jgi:hypothetical protein